MCSPWPMLCACRFDHGRYPISANGKGRTAERRFLQNRTFSWLLKKSSTGGRRRPIGLDLALGFPRYEAVLFDESVERTPADAEGIGCVHLVAFHLLECALNLPPLHFLKIEKADRIMVQLASLNIERGFIDFVRPRQLKGHISFGSLVAFANSLCGFGFADERIRHAGLAT